MRVTVQKGVARGTVSAPPSKSMVHRLLICAAMSEGESIVRGISASEDMRATLDCLGALGAVCEQDGATVRIRGIDPRSSRPEQPLFCRESGSTLRFMIPIACLSGNETQLHGEASLMRRPMGIYEALCKEKNMYFSQSAGGITVRGTLPSGTYRVLGNVSSQFISGLLFALPLTEGDSRIEIVPPIESRSYIDLTLSALRTFGVTAEWESETAIFIRGGQRYRAADVRVEGDYSNAAFLDAFSLLGGEVRVEGLSEDSLQGDRVYRSYFQQLEKGSPTLPIDDCPDLGPILFTLAAAKHGATFTGTRRLRIKESDRVATVAEELSRFGAHLEVFEDSVTVYPATLHAPDGEIHGHNDHRVVMSMAVLLSAFGGDIEGAEAVRKSFPNFFDVMKSLGFEVTIHEI